MNTHTATTTDLFWSERGEITCKDHAPYKGSDTWVWDKWSKMTTALRLDWVRVNGSPAKCEVCG